MRTKLSLLITVVLSTLLIACQPLVGCADSAQKYMRNFSFGETLLVADVTYPGWGNPDLKDYITFQGCVDPGMHVPQQATAAADFGVELAVWLDGNWTNSICPQGAEAYEFRILSGRDIPVYVLYTEEFSRWNSSEMGKIPGGFSCGNDIRFIAEAYAEGHSSLLYLDGEVVADYRD